MNFSLQSADFLEDNRFKLLVKISLDDIEIRKGSMNFPFSFLLLNYGKC